MLRSFVSLLLFAGLSTGVSPSLEPAPPQPFDPASLLEVNSIPFPVSDSLAPSVEAKAALLMDADSGIILFEKSANERLPMASLTKIMTASLILEHHSLDEVVSVEADFVGLEGVRMWLQRYERITVGDLLAGLLIPSAGDAAVALAEHHSGSVEAFVEEMNQKARDLQMRDTHFVNPVGLDADNHYSTARDLATLTKHALRFPDFRRIVAIQSLVVSSLNGRISHELNNTNLLLGSYLDILGVKTGTTDEAGQSLINLARGSRGQEVISVLLNSPSRFQESKSMLDWALRSHRW